MLDMRGLKAARESETSQLAKDKPHEGGDRDFKYLWINPASLKPGVTYRFRVLPSHPEKCVKGYRHYAVHKIQKDLGGGQDSIGKYLCPRCNDKSADCFFCDLAVCIRDEKIVEKLPEESLRKAVATLFPKVSYLWPTLFRVRSEPSANNPHFSDYIYDPKQPEQCAVFNVTQSTILDALEEIGKDYRDFSLGDDRGHYLRIKRPDGRGKPYIVKAEPEPCELETDWAELKDCYPPIDTFGANNTFDQFTAEAFLQSTWWWEHVEKHIEFEED